ncbi:MAG TPA: copper resistance CopC family protein [Alphaproteobacteria bacterium]|nr:copper resistance CopC family protein [Alphaproteobacteria bacterium]
MGIVQVVVAGALAVAAMVYGGEAAAHASLVAATPPAGGVAAAPQEVMLVFTERIDAAFSTVEVRDSSGERVDAGNTHVDAGNPKCLRVSLPPLPRGAYRVLWKAVATDMHVKNGDFTFRIEP